MHLVVVHGWKKEASEVAKTIAETMGCLAFEAQQKIAGGSPAVLTNYADPIQAEALATRLSQDGVPAFVLDTVGVRSDNQPFNVRSFILEEQSLWLESATGESCAIDYDTIELMLVATCNAGQAPANDTTTIRKFSLGKTLLAGGMPMTKKVKSVETVTADERDETLWLYARGQATAFFNRGILSYDGLGSAKQLTRDLNFTFLKTELQRLAPTALYDDRLLKLAGLIRLLGPALSPEADLDLACEVLACSLRDNPDSGSD